MNLAVIKSALPDFDIESFNMFNEIISLKWEVVFDDKFGEEHKNLILEMTGSNNYKILMECKDVESFRFEGNGQILGFYIGDMSVRGYENSSKYEVGDYEEEALSFYCSDIVIKSIERSER
ncbi:MAG: hypothetical protein NC337_07090 [Roseburia sp.]|nr:hypothetical protein [Roseburia sp.]